MRSVNCSVVYLAGFAIRRNQTIKKEFSEKRNSSLKTQKIIVLKCLTIFVAFNFALGILGFQGFAFVVEFFTLGDRNI